MTLKKIKQEIIDDLRFYCQVFLKYNISDESLEYVYSRMNSENYWTELLFLDTVVILKKRNSRFSRSFKDYYLIVELRYETGLPLLDEVELKLREKLLNKPIYKHKLKDWDSAPDLILWHIPNDKEVYRAKKH